jgi:hypothetical protein
MATIITLETMHELMEQGTMYVARSIEELVRSESFETLYVRFCRSHGFGAYDDSTSAHLEYLMTKEGVEAPSDLVLRALASEVADVLIDLLKEKRGFTCCNASLLIDLVQHARRPEAVGV